jgi:DNA repair exonuclease SbcCD ATPase subunit
MPVNKTINEVLKPSKQLKEGIGVLAREEWLKLQAFTKMAIHDTPATEELMRGKLKLNPDATLDQDFKDTVNLYGKLKSYCSTFEETIKPQTIGLASDIVQYERRVEVIYDRLIKLITDYTIDHTVSAEKLKKLEDEWKKDRPSPEAEEIKTKFKSYIERLKTEAEERRQKAADLQAKLTAFQTNLNQSKSDFNQNFEKYRSKYETVDKELEQVKRDIKDLEGELALARKKHSDETIVLETAPLYLLIPGVGPIVMAGVLIGVGVDYGLLIESLKGKESKMKEFVKNCGIKQGFFELIKTAKELTDHTAKELAKILPLVDKLVRAWDALTSDLADLSEKLLSKAKADSAAEDWDMASMDLEEARKTWAELKEQADQYRRFTEVKSVETVAELSAGMKTAA